MARNTGFARNSEEITTRGFKPRRGTRRGFHWSDDSVRYIIENQVYKGVLEYEDVNLTGIIPPIVDEETWNRAQVLRKLPSRSQQSQHLLSGLLYCTHCNHKGWTIVHNGRNYTGKDGKKHKRVIRYMCRTKRDINASACKVKHLDKFSLEKSLMDLVFSLTDESLLNKEYIKRETRVTANKETKGELSRLNNELSKTRTLMDELFADYYDNRLITREQFTRKNTEYLEREKLLLGKIEEIKDDTPSKALEDMKIVFATIKVMKENWSLLTENEKRIYLRQVVKQIDVYPDRVEVDFFIFKKPIKFNMDSGATLYF